MVQCTSKDSVLTPYFRSVVGFVFFSPMASREKEQGGKRWGREKERKVKREKGREREYAFPFFS